jgi:kynurenine formamidase
VRYFATHYLLDRGVLTLVNKQFKKRLEKAVQLICLPLPIKGCEASICRAVVIED